MYLLQVGCGILALLEIPSPGRILETVASEYEYLGCLRTQSRMGAQYQVAGGAVG